MSINAVFRRLSQREVSRILEEDDASSFAVRAGDFVAGMADRLRELGAPAEVVEQARARRSRDRRRRRLRSGAPAPAVPGLADRPPADEGAGVLVWYW